MTIRAEPSIRVFFTGLLIMRREGEAPHAPRVKVWGHHKSEMHQLRISLIPRNGVNYPKHTCIDATSYITPQGAGDKPWTKEIELAVGDPEFPAITMFETSEFDRQQKAQNSARDFRWVITLDGPEFIDHPLNFERGSLTPPFLMSCGEFYTAAKHEVTVTKFANPVRAEVGLVIGADVHLKDSSDACLKFYDSEGGAVSLPLKTGAEKGDYTQWDIYVTNLPPMPSEGDQDLSGGHFQMYYGIINNVSPEEQVRVTGEDSDVPGKFNISYQSPCIPVNLEQSDI